MNRPLSQLIYCLVGISVLALSPISCEKKHEGNFLVSFELPNGQPTLGPSSIEFTVTDRQSGEAIENAQIQLEGNMSHPGMAPVFAKVLELGKGKYKANIEFNMAGDWILTTNIHSKDGRKGDQSFNLRL